MTLGAYMTLLVKALGVNIWLSMGIGAIATIAVALLCEKIIWAPMRAKRATSTSLIIISIGLALFIRNGIILIWGGDNQSYQLPVQEALQIGKVRIPFYDLIVVGLSIAAILAVHYLLQNTKVGKAMRAVADDLDLARVTGINVDRVIMWTWIIAAGLTSLSGSMLGLVEAVRPNMGWFLIINLFAAVILGGIGNPYGAITGAFVIGIAQETVPVIASKLMSLQPFLAFLLPLSRWEYKGAIALLIMVLVLLVRPQGLFRGTA
jgi:neutral amino acid transport system permease protein